MMTDDRLIDAAVDVARRASNGQPVPESVTSMIRAIASTREEARRHELELRAQVRAGDLTAIGLQVLRVALALA